MTISGKIWATLDQMADQLQYTYWADAHYIFGGRKWHLPPNKTLTVYLNGMVADSLSKARTAFLTWTKYSGIIFQEISEYNQADIKCADVGSAAYTGVTYWTTGGIDQNRIGNAYINVGKSFSSGNSAYRLQSWIHEIGHALGLGHMGNYNANANFAADATFANDTWQYSIMSYFAQNASPDTVAVASKAYLVSPAIADIYTIQRIYGVSGVAAGDTTHTIVANVAQTIFDQGGFDTLDLASLTSGLRINLNQGAFSDIGALKGSLGIALGTVIENVTTGSGADKILGNDAANVINSGAGADTIYGAGGADTLLGGAGADLFVAGSGDVIADYADGSDAIDVSGLEIERWSQLRAAMRQVGQDVVISTSGQTVTIRGVSVALLSPEDFVGISVDAEQDTAPVLLNTNGTVTVVAEGSVPLPILTNDNGSVTAQAG